MIRSHIRCGRPRVRIPRESGDDPGGAFLSHVWAPVFPARAGMIPTIKPILKGVTSIPRESGDDPVLRGMGGRATAYSPRERG